MAWVIIKGKAACQIKPQPFPRPHDHSSTQLHCLWAEKNPQVPFFD